MILTSLVFIHNGNIPSKFTCMGAGKHPHLKWEKVPDGTKSFVLIVDDPDAPGGEKDPFVHWLVYNIPPTTTELPEDAVLPSESGEGINSGNTIGWYPPCPPSGTHRYFFKLYALDIFLTFNKSPNKAQILEAMEGHMLAKTELIGNFSKSFK